MLDKPKGVPGDARDKPVDEESREDRDRMKSGNADDVVVSSDDSFPASDPPSWNPVGGVGGSRDRKQKKK